jgi:hypothetical protein
MRISLFEFAEAILLRIFDALLSVIASKTAVLDVNMLDLSVNERTDYKGLLGYNPRKVPLVVIFL